MISWGAKNHTCGRWNIGRDGNASSSVAARGRRAAPRATCSCSWTWRSDGGLEGGTERELLLMPRYLYRNSIDIDGSLHEHALHSQHGTAPTPSQSSPREPVQSSPVSPKLGGLLVGSALTNHVAGTTALRNVSLFHSSARARVPNARTGLRL